MANSKYFPDLQNGKSDADVEQIEQAFSDIESDMETKVTKEEGKGLSTNDFSNAEKEKLSGIEEGANKYILPDDVVKEEKLQEELSEQKTELQEELGTHKTDPSAHEEAFAEERKYFNPIYCNALKGAQEGQSLTISDAVEGTPLSLSLYGKTLYHAGQHNSDRSPDNPVKLTGIGESGSVTVRVTDADGVEETIENPLSKPLYRIEAAPTGTYWTTRSDKIQDGKLIRELCCEEFDGSENWLKSNQGTQEGINRYVLGNLRSDKRGGPCPVACSHFETYEGYSITGDTNNENVAVFYSFERGEGQLGIFVSDERFPTLEGFKAWLSEQKEAGTPVCIVHTTEAEEEDISDTEAGRALFALTSQNGMTITTGEGAEMKAEYNRDINKALDELAAAIVASV